MEISFWWVFNRQFSVCFAFLLLLLLLSLFILFSFYMWQEKKNMNENDNKFHTLNARWPLKRTKFIAFQHNDDAKKKKNHFESNANYYFLRLSYHKHYFDVRKMSTKNNQNKPFIYWMKFFLSLPLYSHISFCWSLFLSLALFLSLRLAVFIKMLSKQNASIKIKKIKEK